MPKFSIIIDIQIILKIFAYTISGFWQSRRNRIDLLITGMGIFWVATHFFVALPASVVGGETRLKKFTYTFGFVVVILRFFTIAGLLLFLSDKIIPIRSEQHPEDVDADSRDVKKK